MKRNPFNDSYDANDSGDSESGINQSQQCKSKTNLFDDSGDSESENITANSGKFELRTNASYIKHYNEQCKRQLMQKFKDKKISSEFDQELNDSSSDTSSSDDTDEDIDPKFTQKFLKTMACLKKKDPSMYDKNAIFFDDEASEITTDENQENLDDENKSQSSKIKKDKPITLKDYERQVILEKEGKFEDDCDDDILTSERAGRDVSPCIAEQEKQLKAEFKSILDKESEEEENEEEFGGIFKPRKKNEDETNNQNANYLEWLAGKQECVDKETEETLKPLKNYWSSTQLPASEKFLRDFILNKGYQDAKSYSEIPTYDEIVENEPNLVDDEKDLEEQALFEHKYNYRYEEEDPEFIKRYPRTIPASVRRTNDKRKEKRREIKNRKQQEKEEKMRELEIVKEAKRKEIMDKIEKLKLVTGNNELNIKEEELDEEFDPDAHDKRMAEIFNDEYYKEEEGENKPECPSDIEELQVDNWDNFDPHQPIDYDKDDISSTNEPHCEDDDFIMDCDYNPEQGNEQLQQELIENSRKTRGKNRRRNKFLKMLNAEKPLFDPNGDKTYAEYVEEYYNLHYEDLIDGQPCRFKYVSTTPNDFGLTVEEILLAKNKELNQWASLKKAVQIRPDNVEKREQNIYKLKGRNTNLKRKILKSLYDEEPSDDEKDKDDKGKEKENVTETVNNETNDKESNQDEDQLSKVTETLATSRKRKRKQKNKKNLKQELLSDNKEPRNSDNENNKSFKLSEDKVNAVNQNDCKKLKSVEKTLDEVESSSQENNMKVVKYKKSDKESEQRDNKSSETFVTMQKQNFKQKGKNLYKEKSIDEKQLQNFNNEENKKIKLDLSETRHKYILDKFSPNTELKSIKNSNQLLKFKKDDIKRKIFSKKPVTTSHIKLDNDREITDERLRAYGSSMYKFKKQKYKKKKQNNK